MTAGRHFRRLVTAGTRHGADATTAGRHLHLTPAEMTIDGTTVESDTAVIVASLRLAPGGIVGTRTRSRGRHLVRVRVLRHAKRAHGTVTVLVLLITTAEEMFHGTEQGSLALMMMMSVYWEYLLKVSASCPSVLYVYYHPAPPSSVPPATFHVVHVVFLLNVLIWPISETPKALIIFVPQSGEYWWLVLK
jgi:hypothetical protein